MQFCLTLAALLLTTSPLYATESLQWDSQYVASTTASNSIKNSVLYSKSLSSTLTTELGARLYSSTFDIGGLAYKGEFKYFPFSFWGLGVRAEQVYFTASSHSLTHLAPLTYLYLPFFSWFRIRSTFGWFERFTSRTKALVVPTFNSDNREHDFLIDFGFEIQPLSEWTLVTKIGTLEKLEIYNLQNPYFEGNLIFQPTNQSWEAMALFRYKVLLGFGRLDELVMGLGLKWLL